MSKLYVGAARRNIDPTPDMFPMPTRFTVADAIYDSCYVRAIALKSGDKTFLMMIAELSDYPTADNFIARIAEAAGIPEENVLFTFTHNHTSPCDEANSFRAGSEPPELQPHREMYKEIELKNFIEAAKEAVATMRPASVGFGTVNSYVNVNRDFENNAGYWIECPNYEGYSDKTLAVIKFVDEEGKLIAAILNHGTHSTSAFLQKDSDHLVKTSGNFSGVAAKFAERRFEGSVIAWTAGAAGNQNPLISHGLQYEYPDGYTSGVSYPDGVGFMIMEYLGRRHGADAVKCIEGIDTYTDDVELSHSSTVLLLPAQKRRKLPSGQRMNNRMGGKGLRDENEVPYGMLPPIPDLSATVEPDPDNPVKMHVHLLTIGDIALVLTNGEMYAELGRGIKELSPFEKTVVVTYSTTTCTGYILDKSSKHHKVFQCTSPAIPGMADEIIYEGTAALLKAAKG